MKILNTGKMLPAFICFMTAGLFGTSVCSALNVTVDLDTGDRIIGRLELLNDNAVVIESEALGKVSSDRKHIASISPVMIELDTGEKVGGEVTGADISHYHIASPAIGDVSIPKSHVMSKDTILYKESENVSDRSVSMTAQGMEPPKWSGQISGGFNRSRGNVESSELNSSFSFTRKNRVEEFTVKGRGYYSERNRKMNSRKYGGSARTAFSFGEDYKWYHFYMLAADHDFFGNVDFRTVPSAGVGYWFSDTLPLKLMVELAGGVQHTSFVDASPSDTELVAVPRLFAETAIYENILLSEEFTIYPSIREFGEFRYISETALKMPVNDRISVKLSVIHERDSDPGLNTKNNDLRILSTLTYLFE